MRMKTLALLSAATLLSLTACHNTAEENAAAAKGAATDAADANAAAAEAATPANAGAAFTKLAAASDAFEIGSSKLAASNDASPKVKAFATQMIEAHTDSTAKLQGLAASITPAIMPDPSLTPDQQQTLDTLKAKMGADFDSAYVAAQVDAHTKTLEALKAYAAAGAVPELKAFAASMIPTVTAHLNMAKALAH